jgi:tetratricopeptide (TPR) repeat protein
MSSVFFEAQRAHQAGDLVAAERGYLNVLAGNPTSPEALHYLGLIYLDRGGVAVARTVLLKSLCIAPVTGLFWSNCGKAFARSEYRHLAVRFVMRGAILAPDSRDAVYSLAKMLEGAELFDQAISVFNRVRCLAPADFEAVVSTAVCFKNKADWHSALREYRTCLKLKPNDPDVLYSTAHCHLPIGEFSAGWEAYDYRFAASVNATHASTAKRLSLKRPPWVDSSSKSRVMVWAEQGVGDQIMFGSLLEEFRQRCAELIVQLDDRLVELFQRSFPSVRFYTDALQIPDTAYDLQIPMGSLARYLRPDITSFSGRVSRYLFATPGLGDIYRRQLAPDSGTKLIGLSWRSFAADTGERRSVALSDLVSALITQESSTAGHGSCSRQLRFVNLQYGDVADELESIKASLGVEVVSVPGLDNQSNLDALAGLIEACDDVVSIGNATAHLSGALGKRTWVLLPYVAGWRWLRHGSYCHWYQSVTLIHQSSAGDWSTVLDRLRVCLR